MPTSQAGDVVHVLHDRSREQAADDADERRADHEEGHRSRRSRREPVGQVQDDPGKEPCLGEPQQDAQQPEAPGTAHRHGGTSDQAPGNQNAGDPAAGASAGQDQIAGHLEKKIAQVEGARAKTEGKRTDAEVIQHSPFESGEADAVAVEQVDHVKQEQQRQQPPAHPVQKLPFGRRVHRSPLKV